MEQTRPASKARGTLDMQESPSAPSSSYREKTGHRHKNEHARFRNRQDHSKKVEIDADLCKISSGTTADPTYLQSEGKDPARCRIERVRARNIERQTRGKGGSVLIVGYDSHEPRDDDSFSFWVGQI